MDIGWQLGRRGGHAVPGIPEIGNLNGFWNHFQCPSDHLYQEMFQFSLLFYQIVLLWSKLRK